MFWTRVVGLTHAGLSPTERAAGNSSNLLCREDLSEMTRLRAAFSGIITDKMQLVAHW